MDDRESAQCSVPLRGGAGCKIPSSGEENSTSRIWQLLCQMRGDKLQLRAAAAALLPQASACMREAGWAQHGNWVPHTPKEEVHFLNQGGGKIQNYPFEMLLVHIKCN